MDTEYFRRIASKLQEELAEIIETNKQVNDYELIVYRYMFSAELEIPLLEDLAIEMDEESFSIHVIPDNLSFDKLRLLDDAFDKFELIFVVNPYNVIKLKFLLCDRDVQ